MSENVKFKLAVFASGLLLMTTSMLASAELRDPTRPSGFSMMAETDTMEPGQETIRLQAIFYHPKKPSALINGRRYAVGDFVAGGQIKAIESNYIVMETAEGQATLDLSMPTVKSRVKPMKGDTR